MAERPTWAAHLAGTLTFGLAAFAVLPLTGFLPLLLALLAGAAALGALALRAWTWPPARAALAYGGLAAAAFLVASRQPGPVFLLAAFESVLFALKGAHALAAATKPAPL